MGYEISLLVHNQRASFLVVKEEISDLSYTEYPLLSCSCDKLPDKGNLKEEGFILATI